MNARTKTRLALLFAACCLAMFSACAGRGERPTETLTYAIESDGKVYGYRDIEVSRVEEADKSVLLIQESGRSMASALGAEVDSQFRSEYRIDPESWKLVAAEERVDQGSVKLQISAEADGDAVRISIEPGQGNKRVALEPDALFENPVYFPHLIRDFGQVMLQEKRYDVLDLLDRKVYQVVYSLIGTEDLDVEGKKSTAAVFDSLYMDLGLKYRLWIDPESGRLLKLVTPRGVVSLAGKSVKRRLGRANLDKYILAPVDTSIDEVASISRLKVQAVLEPVGNRITAESLNVPGQAFEGTVVNNRIEGIFEVGYARYDGRNAPPFPPADFEARPELRPFLSAEDFIESDDPVLRKKALELVEGSPDSWEAAKRLSRWVAENIGYDIPGGATARNTYDLREGECGAHSRLFAAFARAVGIPARVVWGCMYIRDRGGSFGQHGWNEVYMGEAAGWIPIDATAREIDFADSGHIRLGILASAHIAWNPEKMEILDFEAGPRKSGEVREAGDPEKFRTFLGKYRGPQSRTFTVLVQGGGLAVDIPGRGVFELRDPDERGEWLLKLSSDVGFTFSRDGAGQVSGFVLNNRIRIPRLEEPSAAAGGVPAEFLPYCGRYPIPMDKREFKVGFRRGRLTIALSGERTRDLSGPDESGVWNEKISGNRFSFVKDESGKVRAMILYEIIRCPKLE
jgi:hypothetical protein